MSVAGDLPCSSHTSQVISCVTQSVCVLLRLFGPRLKADPSIGRVCSRFTARSAGNDGAAALSSSAAAPSPCVVGDEPHSRRTLMQRFREAVLGQNELRGFMCAYIAAVHVVALHGVAVLVLGGGRDYLARMVVGAAPPVKGQTLLLAFILWPVSAFGITAGAHRLWSHKSYSAHWILKLALMLCNSMANQGSIYHWARDHRVHHLHSDTAADPHDRHRGFFYAHVGWLLVRKPRAVIEAGRAVDTSDLQRDGIVMLQKRLDPWWNFLWAFAVPSLASWYLWNDTLWNGFLFPGVLRYVFLLHCTWAVNSVVHSDLFGNPSPYDEDSPPSESRLVSFLAMGEGWHSWHHAFPFDYAAAELGSLEQYNPTKMLLDLCALLGLVHNRKTGHRWWHERKRRLLKKRAEELGEDVENVECVEELEGPPLWKMRKLTYRVKRRGDGAKAAGGQPASSGRPDGTGGPGRRRE